jgi:hypothetical protein
MTAKDMLLIPDSRAQQARALGNRLLEQHLKHLDVVQRRAMKEKKDDIDALLTVVTQLSRSITPVVRLHHQIWKEDAPPEEILTTIHRLLGLDEERIATEETP